MSTPKNTHVDIENVYFYYTSIATPIQKYQTTADTDKQYTTQVFMSKEQFKEFVDAFPNKKTTPVENDDFEQKYKTPVPFPDQPMQYFIKFTQRAYNAKGNPIAESLVPKVYQFDDQGVQQDITSTLIGNGSKGTIRYQTWASTQGIHAGKLNASLHSILITDLIPYVKADPNSFAPR